jgi:hypothetical protein
MGKGFGVFGRAFCCAIDGAYVLVIDWHMNSYAKSPRAALPALIVALLLLAALIFKGAATQAPSVAVTKAETGFDATAAIARLSTILGDERPHPVDSPANDAVRERLLAQIVALGYQPQVRDDFTCNGAKRWGGASCSRVRNVLFRAGPEGGNAVMVASHYDSVPAGPGAADDGIGVASALEIAARLKGRTLPKPVIFLFTDGEEVGLLGAASFVRTDPWANDVALAINLEARGTGGPAIMFQTSMPNGREMAALTHKRVRTMANSMAADIYRTLPNDTDATEFLAKKYDVLNFAIIDPVARYHTPLDSLKYLEPQSVGHMGGAALAAVEGHLAAGPAQGVEPHKIYSDVLGRFMIVLPQMLGYVLLAAGFLAAGFSFVTNGPKGAVRALLAPVLSALVAGGIGYGAMLLIAKLRPEDAWWGATPMAAKIVIYSAATLAIILALMACRGVARARVAAAGWLWLSGLFLGLAVVSPGAMILVAPAAGVFAVVAIIGFLAKAKLPGALAWLGLLPALLLLIMVLPVLDFAEVGLGFEMGWGFGALAALIGFLALVPFVGGDAGLGKVSLVLLLPLIAGVAWASLAPAYSRDIPRPLNVQHVHGQQADNWVLTPMTGPPPSAMAAVAAFKKAKVPGNDVERFSAPAPVPRVPTAGATITVVNETISGSNRLVNLRITSTNADEVGVLVPADAKLTQVTTGAAASAQPVAFDAGERKTFRCVGRACAVWEMQVLVGLTKSNWTIKTLKRGHGPEADAVLKARPNTAQPVQGGDVAIHAVDVPI